MSASPDDLETQRTLDAGRWLPEIPVEPLVARYQVVGDPIGRGGFGVIYRAKKLHLPQHVAVKRLRTADGNAPSWSEQQRFVGEVTLAASLQHPNIVRIHDWGRDADGLYVVMDLVEGGSLQKLVDDHSSVPASKLLRYARQICLGLQEAHRSGILHRDLKPSNILLDRFGNVLLTDFVFARSTSGDSETLVRSSGKPMYTYAHMSPEQIAGEPLDVRSDLFSLGATLYHLANGKPAYDRDFDLEGIPEGLHPLLSGLLKKKRDQRPATVDAVLKQLNELRKRRVTTQLSRPSRKPARPTPLKKSSDVPVEPPELVLAAPGPEVMAKVAQQQSLARELLSQQLYAEAVAALEKIPVEHEHALDAALYQECRALRDQVQTLEHEIKTAVTEKRFDGVSKKITALQHLQPWRTDLEWLLKSLPTEVVVEGPPLLTAPFDARAAKAAQETLAKSLGQPEEWTNSVGMKFRPIPAGKYKKMAITMPFWLGIHQVTQGQWQQVMGTTPWKGQTWTIEGSDVAASYISWDDAVAFCEALSRTEGKHYRLPTEAEWEWACRAGTTTAFSFGSDEKQLVTYAWFQGCEFGKDQKCAQRVGQKGANPFGLFDVHGNVWEWCKDWHGDVNPMDTDTNDFQGPPSGSLRILRGGSWSTSPINLRSSLRNCSPPCRCYGNTGCRVVLEQP